MTAQRSDILINDSDIDLGFLHPYSIRGANADQGDDSMVFPVAPEFPESNQICSALWRGYVATMRLHADGHLELVKYDFPFAERGTPPQICNAFFAGDFFLIFCPFFAGPKTSVPFYAGIVDPNKENWQIEEQTVAGIVQSVVCDRSSKEPIGLLVDIGAQAFAPRSLVPLSYRDSLDSLVGEQLRFSICDLRRDRNCIILEVVDLPRHLMR